MITPIAIKKCATPEQTTAKIRRELRKDFADWMTTNEDSVWRPAIELTMQGNEFIAKTLMSSVHPVDVEVMIAPEIMLITGTVDHTKLLSSVKFPRPIDPGRAYAEIEDGMLLVRVAVAGAALEQVALPMAA